MSLRSRNLYHPFLDKSLGIFISNDTQVSHMGQMIHDIDLYDQPVQEPLLSMIFLGMKICIIVAAEYLHFKVYKLMKKENGILKNITQLYICVQMFDLPFANLFAASTDFIYPLTEVIGAWFCHGAYFLCHFLSLIIMSHSLISALMRYCFILQRRTVDKYGKENTKKLFLYLHILLPLFLTIWYMGISEFHSLSFINKCYGKHDQIFLIDSSSLNVAKRNFCAFGDHQTNDDRSKILLVMRHLLCIGPTIAGLIIGLNITEGILYFLIFRHITR